MPIYEYRCRSCGFQKEFLQRINDAPHTKCPECGKRTFEKLVTAAGFQLKGTGWYATDFKNSGAKASKKDAGGDSASKDASSSTDASSKETKKETSTKTTSTSGSSSSD